MKRGFPNEDNYKVMVQCCTYNQSQYIEDALRGFAMQQTTFPFVCCVFDDASTDGEQEVLKRWIFNHCDSEKIEIYDHPLTVIIKAADNDNSNCIYAIHLLKKNLFGRLEKRELIAYWNNQCEYIALCEGDDYWIDPLKIKKQVEYMELYPKCSLLHTLFQFFTQHDATIHEANIDKDIYEQSSNEQRNVACEIIDFKYRVVTASTFFRSKLYQYINNEEYYHRHKFMLGDIQLWTMLLQYGEIGYISDVTTVYRVHAGSACRQVDIKSDAKMSLSISEMQMYFHPKVKGAEYLRSKFCKQFKKNLFKYRLFEPTYSSCIVNNCDLNKFVDLLLSIKLFRLLMIKLLKYKRMLLNNSPVKIKSMK